jgi:hypothetical protein
LAQIVAYVGGALAIVGAISLFLFGGVPRLRALWRRRRASAAGTGAGSAAAATRAAGAPAAADPEMASANPFATPVVERTQAEVGPRAIAVPAATGVLPTRPEGAPLEEDEIQEVQRTLPT